MEKAEIAKWSPSIQTVATEGADDGVSPPPTVASDAQPTALEDDRRSSKWLPAAKVDGDDDFSVIATHTCIHAYMHARIHAF